MMTDLSLRVTRGDATMLYATSVGSYTVRLHLRLDRKIDAAKMRKAVDLTAGRYPYLCVRLRRNDKEFFYEANEAPVALLNTPGMITLGSAETNHHIWAVCYAEDHLYLDFFHGRMDGTAAYFLLATLLWCYFRQDEECSDSTGIRTPDQPAAEAEVHDPVEDLPTIDLSALHLPPAPSALNLMKESALARTEDKGKILKLMIPESSFLPFTRGNDASPGVMISVLIARAIERVHREHEKPLISYYVVNARPMLHAPDTFHNCTNRVVFHYDDRIRNMPLDRQCTVYRGKTILQADEDAIQKGMVIAGSMAQRILDIPDFSMKVQAAGQAIAGLYDASTYIVSYVGKWKHAQIGRHIEEFWTETPAGMFPLIEVAAVNGRIFLSFFSRLRNVCILMPCCRNLRRTESGMSNAEQTGSVWPRSRSSRHRKP